MHTSSSSQTDTSGSRGIAAFAVALTLAQVLVLAYCIANPGVLMALGLVPGARLAVLAIMALCVVKSVFHAWYAWPRRLAVQSSIGG